MSHRYTADDIAKLPIPGIDPTMLPPLVTYEGAAWLLGGIHPRTVANYIRAGELQGYSSGRNRKVVTASIFDHIKRHTN